MEIDYILASKILVLDYFSDTEKNLSIDSISNRILYVVES